MSSSRDSSNVLMTQAFFEKAYPEPKNKNIHTQLGVHFEEVAEMLDAMDSHNPVTRILMAKTKDALENLAAHLKKSDDILIIDNREMFLDGLCDQIVTAVGVGHMLSMDVPGGLGEVNESNDSKFGPKGEPIFDENQKLMKGPEYFKPNLTPYV